MRIDRQPSCWRKEHLGNSSKGSNSSRVDQNITEAHPLDRWHCRRMRTGIRQIKSPAADALLVDYKLLGCVGVLRTDATGDHLSEHGQCRDSPSLWNEAQFRIYQRDRSEEHT